MECEKKPLLGASLEGYLADAHHGEPLLTYDIDSTSTWRSGRTKPSVIRRRKLVIGSLTFAMIVIVAMLASDFDSNNDDTYVVPHYEDSGEDPYKEDSSWIKNTERRFREEQRLRERKIELAKRDEERYNRLKMRWEQGRKNRKGRGRMLKPPVKKKFFIPPSAFPEFEPKPQKTEAELEAEQDAAKMEEELMLEDDEASAREMEIAEFKYILEGSVEPPLSTVPNCINCDTLEVPNECSKAAHTLASNVRNDIQLQLPDIVDPFEANAGRKLAFALAKPVALTNQDPFEEPAGVAKHVVERYLKDWKQDPACAFWTRKCVRKSQRDVNMLPFEKGPEELFVDHILPQSGEILFPNLQEGDFGICAVVGSGANLLGTRRGAEINDHETVFRFIDAPVEGFDKDVGNKTTVAVIKAGMSNNPNVLKSLRKMKDTVTSYHFERLRDWKNLAGEEDELEFTFLGKKLLWSTELSEQTTSKLYKMYLAGTSNRHRLAHIKHNPTSGFRLITALISSRLCLRIDLYGFSAAGGGRYHAPDDYISLSHVLGLEHWLSRLAMQDEMGVCIYD